MWEKGEEEEEARIFEALSQSLCAVSSSDDRHSTIINVFCFIIDSLSNFLYEIHDPVVTE